MRTWILLPLLAASLFGCQDKPGIEGAWKYGRDTVNFYPDHTFVEKDPKGAVGGMWMLSGDVITLTPETVENKPIAQFKAYVLSKAKTPALKNTFAKVCD